MHVLINVKSPSNISNWQMGFNSAFKGLRWRLVWKGASVFLSRHRHAHHILKRVAEICINLSNEQQPVFVCCADGCHGLKTVGFIPLQARPPNLDSSLQNRKCQYLLHWISLLAPAIQFILRSISNYPLSIPRASWSFHVFTVRILCSFWSWLCVACSHHLFISVTLYVKDCGYRPSWHRVSTADVHSSNPCRCYTVHHTWLIIWSPSDIPRSLYTVLTVDKAS
jgi:hypothetical protein